MSLRVKWGATHIRGQSQQCVFATAVLMRDSIFSLLACYNYLSARVSLAVIRVTPPCESPCHAVSSVLLTLKFRKQWSGITLDLPQTGVYTSNPI
jgi:hypothetical protein